MTEEGGKEVKGAVSNAIPYPCLRRLERTRQAGRRKQEEWIEDALVKFRHQLGVAKLLDREQDVLALGRPVLDRTRLVPVLV